MKANKECGEVLSVLGSPSTFRPGEPKDPGLGWCGGGGWRGRGRARNLVGVRRGDRGDRTRRAEHLVLPLGPGRQLVRQAALPPSGQRVRGELLQVPPHLAQHGHEALVQAHLLTVGRVEGCGLNMAETQDIQQSRGQA